MAFCKNTQYGFLFFKAKITLGFIEAGPKANSIDRLSFVDYFKADEKVRLLKIGERWGKKEWGSHNICDSGLWVFKLIPGNNIHGTRNT